MGGADLGLTLFSVGTDFAKSAFTNDLNQDNIYLQDKLNKENQKRQFDYNMLAYSKQRDDQNERQDYLNKTKYTTEVQALRDAGLSPTLSLGAMSSPSAMSAGMSGVSMPSASAAAAPSMGGTSADVGLALNAQHIANETKLANAQSRNLDSQTEGNNINNTFMNLTLDSRAKFTNSDNEKLTYLNGYYLSHPELLDDIADRQTLLNDQILSSIDEINSRIPVNRSEMKFKDAQTALADIQKVFTENEISYLKSKQFRENYTNPSYLLNEIYNVEHNHRLGDTQKNEKIAFLRQCLEECSTKSYQERGFSNDATLQNSAQRHESAITNRNLRQRSAEMKQQNEQFNADLEQKAKFKVVDTSVRIVEDCLSAISPFYERQMQYEHEERMQSERNHHDIVMQDRRFSHDNSMQDRSNRNAVDLEDRRYMHNSDLEDRRFNHQTQRDMMHDQNSYECYDNTIEWFDDYGRKHKQRSRNRKH